MEQPQLQQVAAAPWDSDTKPVQVDHFGLFRWPGPLMCDVKVGGVVPVHCFATKIVSFPECDFSKAVDAGFEWVTWAQA